MRHREDLSNLLYGFDLFLLNSSLCSQEERELAIDLFATFSNTYFIEYCLNCNSKLYLTEDSIREDNLGKHVICRECKCSFDINS